MLPILYLLRRHFFVAEVPSTETAFSRFSFPSVPSGGPRTRLQARISAQRRDEEKPLGA